MTLPPRSHGADHEEGHVWRDNQHGPGGTGTEADQGLPVGRPRCRHVRAPSGLGEPQLPDVLHPGRRRSRRSDTGRRLRPAPSARRGRDPARQVAHRHGRGSGPPLPGLTGRRGAGRHPAHLERDERVARGGRARLRTRQGPAQAGGHPGQLPARADRARRRHRGRVPPAQDPVRDRASAALLPAAHRPADGSAAPVRADNPVPVQGHSGLLVGRHHARGRGGPRAHRRGVDLPDAAAREPEDRRAGLLLQRAGEHVPGRRAAAAPEVAVQLPGTAVAVAGAPSTASRNTRRMLPLASLPQSDALQPRPSSSANSAG